MNRDEIECALCGRAHPRDELELAFVRPDAVAALTDAQRRARLLKESDDLCETRAGEHYVRAVLPLPVEGWDEPYSIGIWVRVEPGVFKRVLDLWEDPAQSDEPPLDAWLANDIPSFPETSGLPVQLQLTGPTSRPYVLVPPSPHPLHREQCNGITAHRASEYSGFFA